MNPNSVDELLASVAARGLRVANLFQFELPGTANMWRWQANLTDGQRFWEFGRGDTAAAALRAALFISANEPGVETSQPLTPPTRQQRRRPEGPVIKDLTPDELDL